MKISSVNEVDYRGSRRATMNQTQHQRWTYRSAWLQALIESIAHNKNAGSSCAVEATAWSGLSEESSIAREGRTFFQENSTSRTYRIQGRQLLLVLRRSKNQLLACYEKYLFNRRRFLSREPVCLMMWSCPLPRRNRHKRKYVQVLFVFVNQIL